MAGDFGSSSFVSKVLGANYNRANNFHPVADKFAMCTGQEVTFEPTSNAHARVDLHYSKSGLHLGGGRGGRWPPLGRVSPPLGIVSLLY